jgi:glutaredoxin
VIRRAAFFTLILASIIAPDAAEAQLYRWVDENGRVRYSDTPPPASAKGVEKKRYGAGGSGEATIPYATQRAMQENPVVLYTAPDCGKICADAKALLDNRGVPYREVVVRSNDQIEDLKKLAGKSQVPTLQVGSQAISGFETAAWTGALDRAGYPSTTAGYKPRPNMAGASLPPVKLYTNSECKELCAAARSILTQRKVPFQEVEVETEAGLDELQKVSGGMSVPVLTIGKVVQKGYEPATYHRLLDASGFPKLAEK